ncbi:MAG TPA: ArsA-related P-loop ATPase [Fredinandcohnia sp.]|nr:ArsA-related P-loop ATPase [Fredinandcohnia sp.]
MSLLDRRLHVNIGKGGVGKTTVTAALALLLAQRGKRVLVAEVRAQNVPAILGARGRGREIAQVAENLWAIALEPKASMREYALMRLHSKVLYRSIFENRLVASFLGFIPSLPELVMLGKVLHEVREGNWDAVVLDAPATGHGLTFLGVSRAVGQTIPAGPLRSETEWMQGLLEDPQATAIHLVAIPEELAVTETTELARAVRERLALPLGMLFLNRHVPERFSDAELEALSRGFAAPQLEAAADAARAHEDRARRSTRYEKQLRGLGLPLTTLPLLYPERAVGRREIETLAARIEAMA